MLTLRFALSVLVWALVISSPGRVIWGQVFPSDGKLPAQANGRELLEAVCPSHVEIGENLGCGKYCPSFTGFGEFHDNFDWSLTRVTLGHFLSGTSDDAVLSMEGCEPHSENFGGTVLLTRNVQQWHMLWYKSGVETSQCHKVQIQNGREILVCMGQYGGQGIVSTALYVEDLLNPTGSLMAGGSPFFEIYDNTGTCGYNDEDETKPVPLTRASVDKVMFLASTSNARSQISVIVSIGRSPMAPEKVQECLDAQNPTGTHRGMVFAPPMRSYHLDFLFDGHDYKPTASSAAIMRALEL